MYFLFLMIFLIIFSPFYCKNAVHNTNNEYVLIDCLLVRLWSVDWVIEF